MAASSGAASPRVQTAHTAVAIEAPCSSSSSDSVGRTSSVHSAHYAKSVESSEGKKIDSARSVGMTPSREDFDQRIITYEKSSKYLANLTDQELSDLLSRATLLGSGIGGQVMTVEVDGTLYFIKKIPLTKIEKKQPPSTLNLFNLPTYYQYRVGSAGFGVWREIAAHEITTRWVRDGECHNFPLMYHRRVLDRTTQPTEPTTPTQETKEVTQDPAEEIAAIVRYWDDSKEVGVRHKAIQEAPADVIVFMEHLPQTLGKWLAVEYPKEGFTEAKITRLEVELNRVATFMKSKGFLHLDAHCFNIMTKDDQIYFADFGLALSKEFDLSSDELSFFEKHSDFDEYFVAYTLVKQLVEEAFFATYGKEENRDILRTYFTLDNRAITLPPNVFAIVERYRPICVLLDTFYHGLQNVSKSTPYPAEELAKAWAKITSPVVEEKKPFDLQGSVNDVCIKLEEKYIFPDMAAKCNAFLQQELQRGAYDAINDPEVLAQTLTRDLQLISGDKHIIVGSRTSQTLKRPQTEQEQLAFLESMTHGLGTYENLLLIPMFDFVKKIPEQMGYLEVHGFQDMHHNDVTFKKFPNAVEASKKAMDKALDDLRLRKPQAVIIDLRNNNGGTPYAVQRLCSYFLAENVQLNTIEWRKEDGIEIEKRNTLSYDEIPLEKRMLDVPMYILTSQNTFSAGEEFANDMKALGRATIVGEVTKGGANPGRIHQLNETFEIFIPDGQSINPHDRSNWEGTGVMPDIALPASEALDHSITLGSKTNFIL